MPQLARIRFATGIAVVACVLLSSVLEAQGIASAAVSGRVLSPEGEPIPGAQLLMTSMSTGTVWAAQASTRGRYGFENVPVGIYRLDARAIGSRPVRIDGLALHLGDRVTRDVVLASASAPMLERVVVTQSPLRDAGAGGPAYSVPGEAVRRLPLRDRNFLGLLAMAPQATGSGLPSVGGQHTRFNAIQVDGGSSGDFFGVNATPGSAAGAKVISLEALDEIRILVAPFDVRQGGFSGGLINAVTRSGTNQFHGAVFATHSRAALVGTDTGGRPIETFNLLQYGVKVGGPIVRDRLHFFAVADVQAREAPFVGAVVAEPATGISAATAERARRIFQDRYRFDPGGADPPVIGQPNSNLFLKLSWQPSTMHWAELSHSRIDASGDQLDRTSRNLPRQNGWQLSGSGHTQTNHTNTTRLKVTSARGTLSNELIASISSVDDRRSSMLNVPLFLVQGDHTTNFLAAGSVRSAQGTALTQRVIEATNNLSWRHESHLVTIGTQNQLLDFHDNIFQDSWGVWTFASVDDLDRGVPSRYEIALPNPLQPGGPRADFRALQLSAYVQDRWQPAPGLTLSLGIRADVPFLDHPPTNARLAANNALGRINTGAFPSGNTQVAPRLGFAWDLGSGRRTTLRGGVGAFTGRPIYAWLASAFANTGLNQMRLICRVQDGVPAPTADLTQLPSRCLNNSAAAATASSVSVFSPEFRYQQTIKYVLGGDHQLGGGFVGSLDIVHTRTRDQLYVSDANIVERGTNSEGRMMYGAITTNGAIRTTRWDSVSFGPVYFFENTSGDRSTAVAMELQKAWAGGGLLHAGYSWSRALDLMSLLGFNGTVILQAAPIDGTLARREPRRSVRDIPHNLTASAVVPVGAGVLTSFFLRARSGTPYAWTVEGDANADSITTNDLLYVPRDSSDVSLLNPPLYRALDRFIESEACMREQRGRVMKRASCRNPMVVSLDASVSKTLGRAIGRGVEVRADVFNLPNLLWHNWGVVRETSVGESRRGILAVKGWDDSARRPRYEVPSVNGEASFPSRKGVVVDASRWRMQLSLRYDF